MDELSNYKDIKGVPYRGGIKEAIILAGGLGTRLRDAVPDLPKCMAPVAGRPFIFFVINYLRSQGIEKFIFSLGFRHERILEYLNDQFVTLNYEYTIEDEPLGTGGAIKLASSKTSEENVLITNGDTLYKIDISKLVAIHYENNAVATLALKPMTDFDRYGIVEVDGKHKITNFLEKQFCKSGNINGGTYLLNIAAFKKIDWPDKFSFEKEFLETKKFNLSGSIQDEYFIDIGIPEDYNKAQIDFLKPPLDLKIIDKTWTILIDRDGVINHEKKEDYILNWTEFRFYDGVKEAFEILNNKFGKIIIVSNQRGVGRKLMPESDLEFIHRNMQQEIVAAGGRIDHIYYCTSIDNTHPNRKPNPGMAFQAKNEIPEIDLNKAVMIGNKLSDMRFSKNAGIYAVFVATTNPDTPFPHPDIDLRYDSLPDFVKAL